MMRKHFILGAALGLLSFFNLTVFAAEPTIVSQRAFGSDNTIRNLPTVVVSSKPDEVLRLWPGDAPNLLPDRQVEETDHKGFIWHTSVPELFVYLPKKELACGTAVIICPGGAYAGVAMRAHVGNALQTFHERGIAVFGLKYRTCYGKNDPEADALADAKRAVQIVRSRAAEWGIDPRRIGVQGYSAGSHLCLNLASRFDEGQPGAPDPLDRVNSRPDFAVLMCPWPYKKRPAEYFPLSRNTPPMFIANARDDKECFALATAVDDRLKTLGVEEMLLVIETGGHDAFHLGLSKSLGSEWPKHLMPWLQKVGMLN